MVHEVTGYAQIEWVYKLEYDETTRIIAGRADYAQKRQNRGSKYCSRMVNRKNWAKCARNETGDKHLGRWVGDVAKPEAIRFIQECITRGNDRNEERIARWETKDHGRAVDRGEQPPPTIVHRPFDPRNLTMGKPTVQREAPADGYPLKWYH